MLSDLLIWQVRKYQLQELIHSEHALQKRSLLITFLKLFEGHENCYFVRIRWYSKMDHRKMDCEKVRIWGSWVL